MIKPSKRIVNVVMAIILVVFVSIFTVFLLKKIIVKKTANGSDNSASVLSAAEILKSFKIVALDSANKYSSQINANSLLQYKSDSEKLGISLATDESMLYSTTDSDKAKDTTDIQSQTAVFMKKAGLKIADTTIYNPNKNLKYATYVNDNAVCQLMSSDEAISAGQSHTHQLTCVDKKAIDGQYSDVEKLLAIGDSDKLVSGYAQTLITANSKDNIKYSILNLNSTGKSQRLLYAAVDDKWEYLGDLLGGGKKYATEKGSIAPELQAKINDAKYKGFLKASLAEG